MNAAPKTVHAIIHGRVQGVGYRAWTSSLARTLGLKGWVRNRTDGSVEAIFCGEPHAVDKMLERCRKGPMLAKVTQIEVRTVSEIPEKKGFYTLETV